MDKPKMASKSHFHTDVEAGRIYWWCACGRSKNQPFCDSSHKGTGIAPVKFQCDKAEKIYFCGCKQTKTPPFCDGTHKSL